MWFLSLPVPSQSAVVTTTGKPLDGRESSDVLNLSHSSNISNISNVILLEILNQEIDSASDEFKIWLMRNFKTLNLLRKKSDWQLMKKWYYFGIKKQEIEKANAEAEWKTQEQLKIEEKKKRQKEIALVNQHKQQEEKLKSELRSQIMLKCQKEKEMMEIKTIQEKFGTKLEIQVRQEMGLPTSQLPSPTFQDTVPTHNPGYGTPSDTPHVTPSSLPSIKKEKFDRDVFTNPQTPPGHREKCKDAENVTPPLSK